MVSGWAGYGGHVVILFPCCRCPVTLSSRHRVVRCRVGAKSWCSWNFGRAYAVGLVSMASGDLRPVPEVVLKRPRKLGRSGYNKRGMGEHKCKSVKMQALTFMEFASSECPSFRPSFPWDSEMLKWLRKIERLSFDRPLKRGLGFGADLTGVGQDQP